MGGGFGDEVSEDLVDGGGGGEGGDSGEVEVAEGRGGREE